MAVHNGWVYIVARRYLEEWLTERSTYLGAAVTERTLVRHTHLLGRKLPFNATAWLGWSAAAWGMDAEMVEPNLRASMNSSNPAGWQLCEPEPLHLANATLLRTITTGTVRPSLPFRPTFNSPALCLFDSRVNGEDVSICSCTRYPPLESGRAVAQLLDVFRGGTSCLAKD